MKDEKRMTAEQVITFMMNMENGKRIEFLYYPKKL